MRQHDYYRAKACIDCTLPERLPLLQLSAKSMESPEKDLADHHLSGTLSLEFTISSYAVKVSKGLRVHIWCRLSYFKCPKNVPKSKSFIPAADATAHPSGHW
ncbi:Hypothetical predicted protein [Olea europaea subsp. europaea]|uniref:Uncharacterized protein n=1 Tax=Olea europaea subsp. europaea TaxID=158383 RepID=A0A8S0TA06_OLEEU|nr:Hypothetical predicted protein [Olea europaea subsp. europaea]